MVVDAAAIAGGCVAADGAAMHRRCPGIEDAAALIEDAAAVGGRVITDGAAILNDQSVFIVDAAA